jgi:hypothetical protein
MAYSHSFTVAPAAFAKMKQQMADTHQFVLTPTTGGASSPGIGESGAVAYKDKLANYTYAPASGTLTVNVTHGDNWIEDLMMDHKIQSAIDAAGKTSAAAAKPPTS